MKLSANLIHNSIAGMESNNLASGRGIEKNIDINTEGKKGWSLETENKIIQKFKGLYTPFSAGGTETDTQKATGTANIINTTINKLVKMHTTDATAWSALPKEITTTLATPAEGYFKYKNAAQASTEANEKFKNEVLAKQAKNILDNALFSTISGIYQVALHKLNTVEQGLESYRSFGAALTPSGTGYYNAAGLESTAISTFADQVYIPKVSTITDWMNSAACMFDKVQPKQTVYNELVQIPVDTKIAMIQEINEKNEVVKTYKREDLYRYMDMRLAPNLAVMRTRSVKLIPAEFMMDIDLHATPLVNNGNAPLLGPKEHVGPQFMLHTIETASGVFEKPVGDVRAGIAVDTATWSEEDRKGKLIPYIPNAAEPNKKYYLTLDYDPQTNVMILLVSKTDTAMEDITGITVEFNLIDPEYTMATRILPKVIQQRTVLKAAKIDKTILPVVTQVYDNLSDRGAPNRLASLIEMVTEFQSNKKEKTWIENVHKIGKLLEMNVGLKDAEGQNADRNDLYATSSVDLNTVNQVNKVEALGLNLGSGLQEIREKLKRRAKSNVYPQLSIFTSSLSLLVLDNKYEVITGKVDETTDSKFLGVPQEVSVNALTYGNNKNNPIQAILVGTDKEDFDVAGTRADGTEIPTAELTHEFKIIPHYNSENVHTTTFLEIPTKVITGTEIRSEQFSTMQSVIIYDGHEVSTIRPAQAKWTVKGSHIRAAV